MATLTFDTMKLVDALEKVQIPREQARAIVDVVRESHDAADVATKGDIALVRKDMDLLRRDLGSDIALVRKNFETLRWMMGIVLGGIIALLVRTFF